MTAKMGPVCDRASDKVRARARACVGCRNQDARANLVRLVSDGERATVWSPSTRSGRGAWIHPDLKCLHRAVKTRAIPRALRAAVKVDSQQLGALLQVANKSIQGGKVLEARDESGLEADGHPMSTQR